jgi:hypothetical protein
MRAQAEAPLLEPLPNSVTIERKHLAASLINTPVLGFGHGSVFGVIDQRATIHTAVSVHKEP